MARNRNGDEALIEVTIGRPVRVDGARVEHSCSVILSGLVAWDIAIFGTSALQAAELALVAVRSRLAGMERSWDFFDDQGLPLSFGWIPDEDAAT